MIPSGIKKRYIYWDLKTHPGASRGERKARVAGRPLDKVDVYGFFELTSLRAVSEHMRVDIERKHLEKVKRGRLTSPDGCIKIEPEIFSLQEILAKRADPANGFKEIGRLCEEKWLELQQKVQSDSVRRGRRGWNVEKQSLIIELTQSAPDVTDTLKRLRLA